MIGTIKLIINPQVEIIFIENEAQYVGGAIFVDIYTSSECSTADIRSECFIMLTTCYIHSIAVNFYSLLSTIMLKRVELCYMEGH